MEVREQTMKKLTRKWKIAIFVIVFYILAVAALALVIDSRHVKFTLRGDQSLTVPLGSSFTEPGRSARTVGRLFGDGKELEVITSGSVDTGKCGSYELTYTVRWHGSEYSTVRTVSVVDAEAPVIELKHTEGYGPSWFTGYEEEGYSAWDNNDGDLTGKVQRKMGDGIITYTVTDRSGNTTSVTREIPAVAPPTITINGDEDLYVNASLSYSDSGATAYDGMGNDLSDHIVTSGSVQPYTPGVYEIVYSISNDMGETVTATRRVTVQAVRCPDTVTPGQKTIYLTFDDGPGPYTDDLLDVLAKYNAKATFFVTNCSPKYNDCIGRAYREGHAIGVHTSSHNYYEIYASEQAYFDDFFAMEDIIHEQTGEYTKLFRFPGGSSNTVSNFNPGIMTRLAKAMTDLGYKYFDWNVTSGDAGETTKTNVVFDNVAEGCTGKKAAIVLQHDIKDYSVNAVEQIILWGLNNGYNFCALDMTSPDAHHGIAN